MTSTGQQTGNAALNRRAGSAARQPGAPEGVLVLCQAGGVGGLQPALWPEHCLLALHLHPDRERSRQSGRRPPSTRATQWMSGKPRASCSCAARGRSMRTAQPRQQSRLCAAALPCRQGAPALQCPTLPSRPLRLRPSVRQLTAGSRKLMPPQLTDRGQPEGMAGARGRSKG